MDQLPQAKPQTQLELISHWRSTAQEIRSEIAASDLDGPTKAIAQTNADMLEACANQLETLPNT